MVEREIIPIGESSDEVSSRTHHSVPDEGSSSSGDNVPLVARYRTPRPTVATTPPPLATVLLPSFERATRSRGTGRAPPPPVDAGADIAASPFNWVREDVLSFSSSMDSADSIRHLFMHYHVVSEAWFNKISLLACKEDERPFMQAAPRGSPFFCCYRDLVTTLGVSFPLTDFQSGLLRRLNVAPSQLHVNSWAHVHIF